MTVFKFKLSKFSLCAHKKLKSQGSSQKPKASVLSIGFNFCSRSVHIYQNLFFQFL